MRLFDERHYTPQQLAEKTRLWATRMVLTEFRSQSNLHCHSAERIDYTSDGRGSVLERDKEVSAAEHYDRTLRRRHRDCRAKSGIPSSPVGRLVPFVSTGVFSIGHHPKYQKSAWIATT
jgi:hypothetical protein